MNNVFTAIVKDGTRLGCVVDGNGPPLLMIHGTGDTHLGWRRIRAHLTPHFTLYLMDRRGRGVSSDREEYALAREWQDVAAMLDSIPERVNVFAHWFGAMCALEAALSATNIRRMCVYEPSVNRNTGNPRRQSAIDEMACLGACGDRDGIVQTHLRNIINASDETIEKQRAQKVA